MGRAYGAKRDYDTYFFRATKVAVTRTIAPVALRGIAAIRFLCRCPCFHTNAAGCRVFFTRNSGATPAPKISPDNSVRKKGQSIEKVIWRSFVKTPNAASWRELSIWNPNQGFNTGGNE